MTEPVTGPDVASPDFEVTKADPKSLDGVGKPVLKTELVDPAVSEKIRRDQDEVRRILALPKGHPELIAYEAAQRAAQQQSPQSGAGAATPDAVSGSPDETDNERYLRQVRESGEKLDKSLGTSPFSKPKEFDMRRYLFWGTLILLLIVACYFAWQAWGRAVEEPKTIVKRALAVAKPIAKPALASLTAPAVNETVHGAPPAKVGASAAVPALAPVPVLAASAPAMGKPVVCPAPVKVAKAVKPKQVSAKVKPKTEVAKAPPAPAKLVPPAIVTPEASAKSAASAPQTNAPSAPAAKLELPKGIPLMPLGEVPTVVCTLKPNQWSKPCGKS